MSRAIPWGPISTSLDMLYTRPLAYKSTTLHVTAPWDMPCLSISLCLCVFTLLHLFLGCSLQGCRDPVSCLPPVDMASHQTPLFAHGVQCHLETSSVTSLVQPLTQESPADTGTAFLSLSLHQCGSLFKIFLRVSVLSSQ